MLDPKIKALLPAIISDTMDILTALTNAPDEMTLPITLAVANFAAQTQYDVDPMAWRKAAVSEFFVVLTPSGGMKTSISDLLLDGVREYEKDREMNYKKAMVDYKIALKQFNKAVDAEAANPTGVTPDEPEKPQGIRYRVEKATVNGLLNTLSDVPFAGLFSSDAGEFFNSHSFQDANKSLEMITVLSKAWSGEMLDRTTGIEQNNLRLHNRRFNMLVLLQQELAGFLKNAAYKDQGFTNRMLISQCELFVKPTADFTPAGKKSVKDLTAQLKPFNDRVVKLLARVENQQINARISRPAPMTLPGEKRNILERLQAQIPVQAEPNEMILDLIHFSDTDGASQMMQDFYNLMSKEQSNPKYAEYANFMSRAYEHCCRLAATLAIFDQQKEISAQYAECAIGLMHYFIDQRLNLNVDGTQKVNHIVEVGKELIKWMKRKGRTEYGRNELNQSGPACYQDLDLEERKRVIADLEARDLIEAYETPSNGTKPKGFVKLL